MDRQNRQILMILSDLLRALGLAVLAVYLYFAGFSLPLVLIVSFILGTFSTIFNPAQRAVIPKILNFDEVADANGLVQVATSLFQSVASAAGGAVVAVIGTIAALGFNSATFAISAVLTAAMTLGTLAKPSLTGIDVGARKSFVSDAADGVRYIASSKGLLYLTVSAGFINLFFAMMAPFIVVYGSDVLKGGAVVYGSLLAAFAIGMGPGALLVGRTKAVAYAGHCLGSNRGLRRSGRSFDGFHQKLPRRISAILYPRSPFRLWQRNLALGCSAYCAIRHAGQILRCRPAGKFRGHASRTSPGSLYHPKRKCSNRFSCCCRGDKCDFPRLPPFKGHAGGRLLYREKSLRCLVG